jgi:hypothetical protein
MPTPPEASLNEEPSMFNELDFRLRASHAKICCQNRVRRAYRQRWHALWPGVLLYIFHVRFGYSDLRKVKLKNIFVVL